jgi:hypothetical protein
VEFHALKAKNGRLSAPSIATLFMDSDSIRSFLGEKLINGSLRRIMCVVRPAYFFLDVRGKFGEHCRINSFYGRWHLFWWQIDLCSVIRYKCSIMKARRQGFTLLECIR